MVTGVPPTISIEAQEALATMAKMPTAQAPDRDDLRGWQVFIEGMREAVRAGLEASTSRGAAADETTKVNVDGLTVYITKPTNPTCQSASDTPGADPAASLVMLNLHGGGFVLGGGDACRLMGLAVSRGLELPTYSVDYRLAPEHQYPAALDDCVGAYRWLLTEHPAHQVVLGGHSAGAALAASVMLRIVSEGLPTPRALILLSPEADLAEQGDSFDTLGRVDFLSAFIDMYRGSHPVDLPFLSPVLGDVAGFPPTFLQSGTKDLFLSNTARMHRALRRSGVRAELHVWEAMPHAGFSGSTPEDAEVYEEVCQFLRTLTSTQPFTESQ